MLLLYKKITADPVQWEKAAFLILFFGLLIAMTSGAHAGTAGDAFDAAVTQWNSWITGNLGKLAALIALAVGSVVAAVKKDWSWFFGAVVLSVGVGVLVGIINASFTAVI